MQQTLKTIFDIQKDQYQSTGKLAVQERIQYLKKLKICIQQQEFSIFEALAKDLRKSQFEAAVTEVYFIYSEIDFAIKNLRRWSRPLRAKATLSSIFSKNRIIYEPKGNCLIISPWNYPFQLTLGPLISAVAAGNTVMIKPSEYSIHTSDIIAKIVAAAFPPSLVYCALGDQDVSTTLLTFPFNHIFFTGSTQVGQIVMRAASAHLSSVTLELGGKSPVLIADNANLKKTAEKVAWGKLLNAGQTCIAPDYVLVHENQEQQFIDYFQAAVQDLFYTPTGDINTDSYAKIINSRHLSRLHGLVHDAKSLGAQIAWKGNGDSQDTLAPIILRDIPTESRIMQEEIFGPILPIVTYSTLDEALRLIQDRPKPLALYIFSDNSKTIDHILENTTSGGVCVNDVILHVSNPNLPFGGVNQSGMGSSHGYFGFKAFSHERSIMYQSRIAFSKFIYPPYTKKERLLKWLKRLM
ncbi:aldehyde dehydrogenase family protein [Sphingobacterium faecale]|uniref:Aldehyde dehydrogenase n=1 Tax=Sphingobacterium faecale TaxID=2803775 RepID=A0ABS1R1C4_9SPHI|nr:aldehyde dehydrogenase family protein [Sphingobacterium faecale]MBL1408100.1 aldehyde dehydrogenase family protein [Sphingobacterium faecale]